MNYEQFSYLTPSAWGIPTIWLCAGILAGIMVLTGLASFIGMKRGKRPVKTLIGIALLMSILGAAVISVFTQPNYLEQKYDWTIKTAALVNEYYGTELTVQEFEALNVFHTSNEDSMNYGAPVNVQYGELPQDFNTLVLGTDQEKLYLFEQLGAEYAEVVPTR